MYHYKYQDKNHYFFLLISTHIKFLFPLLNVVRLWGKSISDHRQFLYKTHSKLTPPNFPCTLHMFLIPNNHHAIHPQYPCRNHHTMSTYLELISFQ